MSMRALYKPEKLSSVPHPPILGALYNYEKNILLIDQKQSTYLSINVKFESF